MIIEDIVFVVLQIWIFVRLFQTMLGWDILGRELFTLVHPFLDLWATAFMCLLMFILFSKEALAITYGRLIHWCFGKPSSLSLQQHLLQ
jgi:hypothetical protein